MPKNKRLRNRNYFAVILAGGSGTRFWPLSRHENPKQFLPLIGGKSLLQLTVERLGPLISPEHILIVTNRLYEKKVLQQLKGSKISKKNLLLEPEGKNTAPAIAWAAHRIHRVHPEAVMAVLPSDHLITEKQLFTKLLQKAKSLAEDNFLVTMGITPERPETGYGYLKIRKMTSGGKDILSVERFVEKPQLDQAKEFLQSGQYLWNSGMFIWKAATILSAFEKFLPNVSQFFKENKGEKQIQSHWRRLPSISIDSGILEKAEKVVTVAAFGMGWSDLGSWEALVNILNSHPRLKPSSKDHLILDCQDTFIFSQKKIVAAIGLQGLTIVETPDALLICRTEQSQKVKDVVADLKAKGRKEWVRHQRGLKGWA